MTVEDTVHASTTRMSIEIQNNLCSLVRKNMVGSVYDVGSRIGLGRSLSAYMVVICRLAFYFRWSGTRCVNEKQCI